jgi:hypothetical protein
MSTWEQRMAARRNVAGTKANRLEAEYQQARWQALEAMRRHNEGPQPPHPTYPKCCWREVWEHSHWLLERICQRSICEHEHHELEGPWMANAA